MPMILYGHDTYPSEDVTCSHGRANFTGSSAEMASVVTNFGGGCNSPTLSAPRRRT
jgi:hypothetical protein